MGSSSRHQDADDEAVLKVVRLAGFGVDMTTIFVRCRWDRRQDPRRVDNALRRLKQRGLVKYHGQRVGWMPVREIP